jgi:hypothetical protein
MKQTVEEAASVYLQKILESTDFEVNSEEDNYDAGSRDAVLDVTERTFIAGAEWQSKQSPWISVKERLPEEGKRVVFILEWRGIHRGYFAGLYKKGKWETEERVYDTISFHGIVVAYMPIPSFDEILEANRDVLERIKQKGD